MKKLVQILGSLFVVVILLIAGVVLYSTERGYMRWYFRVNGQVMIDGRKTNGYLHANSQRTILLLTRTDEPRRETYLVSLGDEKTLFDCGEWHPPRFLPFPVGHENPPCSFFTDDPAKTMDAPITSTLVRGSRSVEFSTAAGRKVEAKW